MDNKLYFMMMRVEHHFQH